MYADQLGKHSGWFVGCGGSERNGDWELRRKWKNTGEKGGRKIRVETICHFKSSRNLVPLLVACPFILARICSLLFEKEADPLGRILLSEEQKAGKRECERDSRYTLKYSRDLQKTSVASETDLCGEEGGPHSQCGRNSKLCSIISTE